MNRPSAAASASTTLYRLISGWLLAGWLLSGCLLGGSGLSARPIGQGAAAVGATLSLTGYDYVDNNGSLEQVRLVNPIPELSLRRGISQQLDIGGRLALGQLALAVDARYRFWRRQTVHLAVAPMMSIQNLRVMNGIRLQVPLVVTVELSDRLALNSSIFALGSRYTTLDPDDAGSEFGVFQGGQLALGGGLSADIQASSRLLVRPGIEVTRYSLGSDEQGFAPFTTVHVFVHVRLAL